MKYIEKQQQPKYYSDINKFLKHMIHNDGQQQFHAVMATGNLRVANP